MSDTADIVREAPASELALSRFVLWYGRYEPPARPTVLRAGPVQALLDGADLRYVTVGGVEVVRRLFVGVRCDRWETIAGELTDRQVEIGEDSFAIRFSSRHRLRDLDFEWQGEIVGNTDGTIVYTMKGHARADFLYNRIGLCLLHPSAGVSGRPYRASTPDGPFESELPTSIGPQVFDDGRYYPLSPPFDALQLDMGEGVEVDFSFEGDLFEIEDQRNWTDASFKTYSTPITIGTPHRALDGQAMDQRVTIAPRAAWSAPEPADGTVALSLGAPLDRQLPSIGFGVPTVGGELTVHERELIAALRPAHLRVDVDLADPERFERLRRAAAMCRELDCALEVALTVTAAEKEQLDDVVRLMGSELGVPLARVIVLGGTTEVTPGPVVRQVRRMLRPFAPDVPVFGGTDHFFTELNRRRPELEAVDGVSFSLNPQIHASDETSMRETLEVQGEVVRNLREIVGELPIAVSPVTLKMRAWVYGEDARGPDELPFPVDVRQMSLFGAAWTLGSLKYLMEAGADTLTYFEAVGWRGLVEREEGPPLPAEFPSAGRMAFPLYHVFADLAEAAGGRLRALTSSDPLAVAGLAVESDAGLFVSVANLTPVPKTVVLDGLPAEPLRSRTLNADNATIAMHAPTRFRARTAVAVAPNGRLTLELAPFELVHLRTGAAG